MKICFTTNNAHKLQEVKEILGDSIELLSLSDIGFEGDIPETHETLEANSLEKAQYIFQKYRIPVFSDDSGLEVVALNGKPGVHTAHYAGSRDAVANMSKVLSELEGQTNNREARFRAVITYIDLEGKEQQFEGIVDGQIAPEMSGAEGFGYDPIFIPKGYEKTFAELSSEVKNTISHRKRALEKLVQFLKSTT
ncbi:MAG: RdgB/HAM1 family non-canonical purine NTP pyrophosphatase [Roseivirga sp.]|uniref:RdgB/HAM1 family non-canonical purine NTP pyrophosphatase n=1 Tax=Roseivirga sp. TaxID=1964215 RepID=UPI001B0E4A09|nr:RdgB/HAM1 family non-canonical purine NTP pyrophosphatase [Roseivirga sp.]MBO6661833.1 RdgB/HAM1 family non-canonical purine NTP pyrophosphatase [Roseivirga sp.]MBO6760111.1 RdgB/HAM1 family non-canonical purine NTP pyrophosphatase [Roseivirga sp.]MBO6908182.1 RdgB/HAM1 family non-canonical purine NTP pyrophosphatase [Roseivirga sp.]